MTNHSNWVMYSVALTNHVERQDLSIERQEHSLFPFLVDGAWASTGTDRRRNVGIHAFIHVFTSRSEVLEPTGHAQ